MLRMTALLNAFFILTLTCISDTIHIPEDYSTIQAGIDSASNGDTLLVAPGTYVENINFLGKAIIVRSILGKEVTVIDGGEPDDPLYGSVVIFINSEGFDSVIDGFTITNGIGSKPPFAGAYIGGGIICYKSSPTIMNNKIVFNSVVGGGGGIWSWGSPIIINNIINNNIATSNPYGSGNGGGILCTNSNNTVLVNNIIASNKSNRGGGIFHTSYLSNMTIVNTVIADNHARIYGGGIYCWGTVSQFIANSIIWNNSASNGKEVSLEAYNEWNINYSVLEGGLSSMYIGPGCNILSEELIDIDPLFVNESNGDYHISYLSPCRDAGNNEYITELVDFEGDPRIYYKVDIGADEFYSHLYCSDNVTSGCPVVGSFIGIPGSSPVLLFISYNLLDPPAQSPYGQFYIGNPVISIHLPPIATNGQLQIQARIPSIPIAPYNIYLQALIADKLTNSFIMAVR